MKVYRDIVTEVCNTRFSEVLANFSERNALKGRGKLDIHAKLLATVGGLSQANKKPAEMVVNDSIKQTDGNSMTAYFCYCCRSCSKLYYPYSRIG